MITLGTTLPNVLETIVLGIEALSRDTIASILLLDADGTHIHYGAAPHLPEEYNRAIEHAAIGPAAGSCGTAMYRRETVIVSDIETDPLWDSYRALVRPYGLRACWSTPVLDREDHVIASFAMYYREPRSPVAADLRLIERATYLAGIAIGRTREAEELRVSEEQFSKAFHVSPAGVTITRIADGTFIDVNDSFCRMFEFSREEVIGRTSTELNMWTPDERSRLIHAQQASGGLRDFEMQARSKSGRMVTIFFSSARLELGSELCLLTTMIDITERERARESLQQSEIRYRQLFEANPHPMWVYDLDTLRFLAVNDAAVSHYGYTAEEFNAMTIEEIRPPEDVPRLRANVGVVTEGIDEAGVWRHVKKDGRVIDVEITSHTLMFDGRKAELVLAQDITERREAEEALRAERDLRERILDTSPVGIAFIDKNGQITFANRRAEETLGLSKDEITQLQYNAPRWRITDFDGRDFPDDRLPFRQVMSTRRPVNDIQHAIQWPDGKRVLLSINASPLFDASGELRGMVAGLDDITERKRAEEALRKNEQILRLFVEHAPAAIAMFDREMRYIAASRRYMLDYRLGDQKLSGRSHYDVFPEMPDRWRDVHQRCLAGAVEKSEEDPFPRADGQTDWVRWDIRPWYESGDTIGGIVLFSEVITERKRAEEEIKTTREQLRALSARLQDVREEERRMIAREIHDELGQNLTALRIELSWCAQKMPAEGKQLREKALSMITLVDDTLRTVRRVATELRPGVLDDFGLVAAIEWQAMEFQKRTGIRCVFQSTPQEMKLGDAVSTALFRIFQESLTNVARHSGAGEVDVRLTQADGVLTLVVRDNGRGIAPSALKGGTSLGLVGMRERATMVGGTLSIHGGEGTGTTVHVTIPIS